MNSFFNHARLRLLGTLLVALLAIVFTTTSSTAQTGGQWDYVDIGATRNSNSAQTGLNIHDPNDGGNATNIQLVERGWGGSHALLFNAYKSDTTVDGGIATVGNTKYANNVGNYNIGAGMLAFFGNNGAMDFYISPSSTGKDTNVDWGVPKLRLQRDGTVGIGTLTPDRRLTIVGGTSTFMNLQTSDDKEVLLGAGASGGVLSVMSDHDLQIRAGGNSTKMTVKADGKVGIGTTAPARMLDIYGSGSADIRMTNTAHGQWWEINTRNEGRLDISHENNSFVLNALPNGNVGIGTTNPSHKLAVDGTIRAKEIIVDTGWSDFVFDEDYDLPTLNDVAGHIDTHGHLPDVPSATQVASNGISLGAMDAILLQKIEELTLYTIAQEEQAELQQEQITKLLQVVEKQQAQIETLQATVAEATKGE